MSIFHQPIILRPGQIAYLAQGPWRLYVETIDYVATKQSYWVRPLILTSQSDPDDSAVERSPQPPAKPAPLAQSTNSILPPTTLLLPPAQNHSSNSYWPHGGWYDARAAAHLVWPQNSFQHALDEDILPWLTVLHSVQPTDCSRTVKVALQEFLRGLWDQPTQD